VPQGPRRLRSVCAQGAQVSALRCDVTVDLDVDELIAGAVETADGLDVSINAAGIVPPEDEAIEWPELFRWVLAVNTAGLYTWGRAAATVMLEAAADRSSTSPRSGASPRRPGG
jgi:NAD(P)-dependent dehydrogenase (short-subunit alcohol dehydrogenase family)